MVIMKGNYAEQFYYIFCILPIVPPGYPSCRYSCLATPGVKLVHTHSFVDLVIHCHRFYEENISNNTSEGLYGAILRIIFPFNVDILKHRHPSATGGKHSLYTKLQKPQLRF